MCGILGAVAKNQVNQLLYDGLLVLQHRGQDAAGIVTAEGATFHMHKGGGMVRDVFRTRNMRGLLGACGIAHTRYPTAGSAFSPAPRKRANWRRAPTPAKRSIWCRHLSVSGHRGGMHRRGAPFLVSRATREPRNLPGPPVSGRYP